MMKNFKQFFRENSGIDVFIISKPENIFYLTGFQGSFGYLLVLKSGESFLITDSRYAEVAENIASTSFSGLSQESSQSRIPFKFILFDKNFKENIKTKISRYFKKLAVENSQTLAQKEYWQEIFPEIEIVVTDKIIQNWRSIKNTNELQKVQKACNKLNKVFDDVDFFRGILQAGITEKEVTFQLEMKLRENGKYKLSFPIIVAFGENSALPHHHPGNRQLKSRENILIDCGVKFENYCSDMTRNFHFGEPSADYLEKFEILLNTQKKIINQFKVGKKLSEADDFCRKELGKNSDFFTHSLGHGVGIEVHEKPSFSKKEKYVFAENQVVTCEPGLYFSGKFGIRIEDQILITEDGPEILTKTSKELIIL